MDYGTTWGSWCDSGTSSTTNGVWGTWTADSSSSATSCNSAVWIYWTSGTSSTTSADSGTYHPIQMREPTPEELERREQRRLEAEERQRKREREQAEADAKAEELLRSMLTQEQLDQLDAMAAFEVKTERARYRIQRGWSGNVKELNENGDPVFSYCIHPRMSLPNADTMLAQKLMLETDEEAFLRMANRTRIY